MPFAGRATTLMPRRLEWPRAESPARTTANSTIGVVPTLVSASSAPPRVRPFRGRSRFVVSPLSLSLDQMLFLITAALLCFGLIMVQSADSRINPNSQENWLPAAFSSKNMLHAAIALLVMTILWRMDYRMFLGRPPRRDSNGVMAMLASPSTWMVVLTVGFLAAVMVTPFGKEINGARRWFGLGPFGFQPSELAKLSLVLFVAAYATHRAGQIRSFFKGFVPLLMVFGLCAALVMKGDFGTTVLIAAVIITMFLMAGCRGWHVAML